MIETVGGQSHAADFLRLLDGLVPTEQK